MKIVLIGVMIVLGLSACATHKVHQDNSYYKRANQASEKAHKEFH